MKLDRLDRELRTGAKRGHAAQSGNALYLIEGEHISLTEVAKRLGVTKHTVQKRFAIARAMSGPVTWERLS